jgi:hypothetical protein
MEFIQLLERLGFTLGGAAFLVAAISFTLYLIRTNVKNINTRIDSEIQILNLKIESAISGHKNLCDKASKSDVCEIKSMITALSTRIDNLIQTFIENQK